ncbi:MAG: fatty acid desaturase [Oligoflexia bacterium]|nr:fatty acid desaturase [Oligoflexia bacterium]MBF0366033.1 fatty acid desaturase [Oligoflexia bacterium]
MKLNILNKEITDHITHSQFCYDWRNIFFVLLFMIVGFGYTPVYYFQNDFHFTYGPWLLAFVLYWVAGLSITMGYHRLYSHRSYTTSKGVEALLLLFGTLALQNSALKWCYDHRLHHRFTDQEKDPYNAQLGFWWSHLVWIFFKPKSAYQYDDALSFQDNLLNEFQGVNDLVANRLVRLQHLLAVPVGFLLSFLIPLLFGLLSNNISEYLLVAGFFRVAITHQSTFCINSIAHLLGRSTYNKKVSAKDNWLCSLFAFGEGYHNYHHAFPNDYRNGVKLFNFDPTKWIIYCFSLVGLTWQLRRKNSC